MKVELQYNLLFKSVSLKIFQSDILNRKPKKIHSGTVVFSKGGHVSSLYLLIEGQINFIDYNFLNRGKDDNKSRIIQAGEFFGYDEIITGKRRTSSAITLTDCEIYELTVNELNSLIAQDSQILDNINPGNSVTQTKKTDPRQNKLSTRESEVYFNFRTKVDIAKEKQIKNKAKISEIDILKESLEKEKIYAENVISEEMKEISNKEKELKKLADSLEREKKLSEASLSKEIVELEEKEIKIKLLEDSIALKKEKAQSLISAKEEEIKIRESELIERASIFEKEKELVDENLKKLNDIEAKEADLLNKFEELSKEKEKVNEIIAREEAIIQKELEIGEITKKIEKEKEAAQDSLQRKQELDDKQMEVESILKKLEEEKINVQIAKEKMDMIEKREAELEAREEKIEEERKILAVNLKKLDEIAEKQDELSKKQERVNEIIGREERIKERELELEEAFKKLNEQNEADKKNLGKELEDKEKEIRRIIEQLAQEKVELQEEREKEKAILQKQLYKESENFDLEKQLAEVALKTELNNIEMREKELSEFGEKLNREKEIHKREIQKEREELLKIIEQNKYEDTRKSYDKKEIEAESEKIKQKEEELAKREESLKREMRLSEATLQKEFEDLLLVEKEVEEKLARFAEAENGIGTTDVKLDEFRKREEELLAKIKELEKRSEPKDTETKGPEPDEFSKTVYEEKTITVETNAASKQVESNVAEETETEIPEYTSSMERNYNIAFQVHHYEDVAIVFVNIQRGVAASALRLKHTLDKLLKESKMKIIVDLSFCEFLDSTFLGVLVTLLKKLNIEGGSLNIVMDTIKIFSSTFFLSGMDRVFNVKTDVNSAIHELLDINNKRNV